MDFCDGKTQNKHRLNLSVRTTLTKGIADLDLSKSGWLIHPFLILGAVAFLIQGSYRKKPVTSSFHLIIYQGKNKDFLRLVIIFDTDKSTSSSLVSAFVCEIGIIIISVL